MAAKYLFQNQNEHKEEKAMNKKVLLLVVTAMMVIAGNVWAADPNWTGGTSTNWSTAANWSAGVPTNISKATVNKVGTYAPTISGAADANQLYVAESNGVLPGAQTVTVATGGNLHVNQEIVLGYGAADDGKLLVTGGTVECNHLFVGYNSGATGRLQIDSGTVDVNQMFGLSWNGGDGYAQLNGGTLHTEQFAFENVAGGTADMNITGGTWQQEHFWWDKIRALVWYGKIKGYGARANVVVTWNPTAGPSGTGQTIVTALANPNTPSFRIVKKTGGEYSTIQAALDAAQAGDVIEVQDSNVYAENLLFKTDANYSTLQSGSGCRPTIRLTGVDSNTLKYISMAASGQTIQGFNIDFSGSASTLDGNSTIIFASGGASTVRDCNIVGTTGYIRGIAGVATIEDVELSNCRIGILCDANEVATGFRYSIFDCHIYDHRLRGVVFADSNAVMDNCLVERCGESYGVPGGNVIADGNQGTLNLLITNSIIREALYGRNFNMEDTGTATIEDSIIMNALGTATHSDEILQYRGTLNLNRCIIKAGQRMCVNMSPPTTQATGSVCNIDHCDFYDPNMALTSNGQWALTTTDPCAVLTVRNSILTGENGYLRNMGTFTSNWNDNFCTNPIGGGGSVVAGPNDIVPGVDPFYIQTDDPNEPNFFALQPYSPVLNKDEFGSYMGSQGPMTGYEKWPADWIPPHGVDFKDFAVLASHWHQDNTIPAGPNHLIENFESYTATGAPGVVGTLLGPRVLNGEPAWRVVPNWANYNLGWLRGTSTLSLLTDANDPNSGSDVNDHQAMRWVYDVNVPPNDVNAVRYTEILVVLPHTEDLNSYDQIRVMLKRHTGNSPDYQTYMYAKFIDLTWVDFPPTPDKYGVVNSVIGGSTASYPDDWYPWTINLHNLAGWQNYGGPANMTRIGAIIFGIRTQSEGPYGLGTGTIDVDNIRLVELPGCSAPPVGDLNGDCKVDFKDVKEFTDYWLDGK
jgi:hypothetical protein